MVLFIMYWMRGYHKTMAAESCGYYSGESWFCRKVSQILSQSVVNVV